MVRFRRVNVEITNVCNLKCNFCPEVGRASLTMAPAMFRRVLTQLAPMTDEVCLHLMGEPLGHPEFAAIIGICAELGTPVNLTTNGLLLHGMRRELALHPIVRQLNVSVHSFEANFAGRDVAPYLTRLFDLTREAMTRRPELYINYRLWDLSPGQDPSPTNARVRAMIGTEFGVDLDSLDVDLRRKKGYRLAGRVYVNFDSRFVWPSLDLPERAERGTCHGLSTHIGVHADGTVVPCCLDKEAVIALGNLQRQDLGDILASPRAEAMRQGFKDGNLVEDLCKRCSFISRFDGKLTKKTPAGLKKARPQAGGATASG